MNNGYITFKEAIDDIHNAFKTTAVKIHTQRWQGVDVSKQPAAAMYELINYNFHVDLPLEDLDYYRKDIMPNIPWADNHFLERVGGLPINPGEQWKHWPWGNHADKFRDQDGQFNHNYMERYWPKKAGLTDKGEDIGEIDGHHKGIRYDYGDLGDLVDQLLHEPHTRQAYLPVFFPEDTGAVHGGRVPCSLGYHFILRDGLLHINYYLRSCEVYRHFRDDCYLTVRLLLWVLEKLREKDPYWNDVAPGMYSMYITSFHCFVNDMRLL